MGKCYDCRYFRIADRKCGYSGYEAYPDKDCGSGEFQRDSVQCCGNCRYYRVEARCCTQSGNSKYPYDRCGIGKYSRG